MNSRLRDRVFGMVALFATVVGLTLIQFRTTGRRVHYGGQ